MLKLLLGSLTLILIPILFQLEPQYVVALPQKMIVDLDYLNFNNPLSDKNSTSTGTKSENTSPLSESVSSSSPTIPQGQEQEQQQQNLSAIEKFQEEFCGINTTPNSNSYITEFTLPQSCEMPLGTAIDNSRHHVWYISTKQGILGSYDTKQNKFGQEHIIPQWNSRESPFDYSQVWAAKLDRKQGDVWFTDTQQNAIWRYINSLQAFEMYKIPGNSSSFGTTYPISLELDSSNHYIFLVGTFSPSLWIGNTAKMRNGTSDGIFQVPIPINGMFEGIDPTLVTTGSLAFDSKRNSIWISMLSYGNKGAIFGYNLGTNSFKTFVLPRELNSPVGMVVDKSGNLWVTNAGTSMFYKLDTTKGNIVKFVTSKASPRIYGGGDIISNIADEHNTQVQNLDNTNNNNDISKNAYTLPYWIQKASDGSLWFNEQEGNKIAKFDPSNMKLIEYWVPTQNRLWGNCGSNHTSSTTSSSNNNTDINIAETCGIANVLQFSLGSNNNKDNHKDKNNANQVWFTEWTENKIGKLDVKKQLPFSVASTPNKELTIKRGESREIKVKVTTPSTGALHSSSSFQFSSTNLDIHMIASGTFTPTGDLGNSTGIFSEQSFSMNAGKSKQVSFTFTPSRDLNPGKYILMIGAENEAVSYIRALKINIL